MQHLQKFKTIEMLNRLQMPIKIDISSLVIHGKTTIVIKANEQHHYSVVAKNIEHIAYQLKRKVCINTERFSLIELRSKKEEEWIQWRFNWAKNTPLKKEPTPVSSGHIRIIKAAMEQAEDLQQAS